MTRAVHVIDADGRALGRIASEAARLLMGKHKPSYQPNRDDGDAVRIIHAGKIKWSGRKLSQKVYHHSSMYPGGLKTKYARELFAADPADVMERAVSRMLPKNTFRVPRLKRLSVER